MENKEPNSDEACDTIKLREARWVKIKVEFRPFSFDDIVYGLQRIRGRRHIYGLLTFHQLHILVCNDLVCNAHAIAEEYLRHFKPRMAKP